MLVQVPNIQPAESQHPQPAPRPNSQTGHSMPIQVSLPDTSASQTQISLRNQQQQQTAIPATSGTGPTTNHQPLSMPLHAPHSAVQPKGHLSVQATQMSLPQSSHIPDVPPLPLHSGSQPLSLHQPQMSNTSNQLQQTLQTTGFPHLPLQPPLPQQPRPHSMPNFHHQLTPQMGPNLGFQHSGPPQMHHSQPMFHVSWK